MQDSSLKRFLLKIWFVAQQYHRFYCAKKYYSLPIMTTEDTIAYIKQHRCSIARLGDGEFSIMLQQSAPDFQKSSVELSVALQQVFSDHSDRLLICLPHAMRSTRGFKRSARRFWNNWCSLHQQAVVQLIRSIDRNSNYYGDAYISRPYSAYKSRRYSKKIFEDLKELWIDQDLLIVEGSATRLGIGNDLFKASKSIQRILCPAENAFDSYQQILDTTISCWNGELVILALGPTATVLASDLSKRDIQALDLGHIDIQYEWYLHNSKDFKPIESKYTNEAIGGRQVGDCHDETYFAQIIAQIH